MGSRNLKSLVDQICAHRAIRTQAPGSRRAAEVTALEALGCIPKPKGQGLENLLAIAGKGKVGKRAFDGLLLPRGLVIDYNDKAAIKTHRTNIIFIEVKTTGREGIGMDFQGFYFSMSDNEMKAAKALGKRYRFAFHNRRTGQTMLLTYAQLMRRVRARQVSHSILI
ncbi:hypothetical protein dsx2_1796 [Desulfovibrio sp. X2]|uniref:hypothetical protein n=1 Tax=Desulfovibrio sp. X2 TaxID=941449 RepID=UPI0003589326|nr:hypothetical protein [Desulfovibrio sp. X2]EPR44201.1 hypothetical protein dsx2_1796 [Desulfovibrio sp. X2]